MRDIGEQFAHLREQSKETAWRYVLDSLMVNLDVLCAGGFDLDKLLSWARQAEDFLKSGTAGQGESPAEALRKFLNA